MTAANGLPETFGITLGFVGEQAVMRLRGEMDLLAAPTLGTLFEAVIAAGFCSIELNLDEVDRFDSAGLRVVSYAAARLAIAGGELTMRSPSGDVSSTLNVERLAEMVRLELDAAVPARLAPEQSTSALGTPIEHEAASRARELRTITSIPADDDVVDGALRLVVALAKSTVGGADGVSVSLRRHGHLATVAATDQTISDMDANQYATGEGPCVDASVKGRWFHAESLDTETRWPAFTPRAQSLGINSILSSPLLAADRPVGALNIYSRTASAFAPKDQQLAGVFATEASTILTSAGVDVTDDDLAARIAGALRVRRIIAQAEGVIMEQHGIPADDAYTLLRETSQRTNQPLRERAEDIVASTATGRNRLST